MREIPLPYGSSEGKATAINNRGEVAGCYFGSTRGLRAFVWSPNAGFRDVHPDNIDGSSCATAINDAGQVAGTADSWGYSIGFVWPSGSKPIFISSPFGQTVVNGINEAGEIVGATISGSSAAAVNNAFVWNARDGLRLLPSSNTSPFARAMDINDLGQVVGFDSRLATLGVFEATPVLWGRSEYERSEFAGRPFEHGCDSPWNPLETENDCAAIAMSINNTGQVAGSIAGRAFRWEPGTGLTSLAMLDAMSRFPVAINASGDIAGTAASSVPTSRVAFVWKRSGEVVELGVLPGKKTSDATGMNDLGQVVGFSR
jgi:uncharacterized membrane protein